MAADMIARGMANSAQKRADSAYDLAAGRALALSVTNIQKLVSDFNTASNTYAKVGDNIYIQQLNVPDFWVFKVDATRADYTYTTDQAFLQAIARNGYVKVGYFQISQLESKHQVTFGYYYGNQFYYNAGHTDQIVPDENGMFFDIPTKDGYVYRDGAYTQIINSTEEAERKQADLDEASARAAEDTALGGRIDAEKTARENADAVEKTLRESADIQLASDIGDEATARAQADDTLQANIDAEGATRASADEALTEALAEEETARQQADATLTTNLTNEVTARQEADEAIIAKFTIPHDPETKVIGGKTYLFANGTPITITDGAGANNVTWYGKNSMFKVPNTMTIPYGSFVFGGGYNKDNGSYFESTFITINSGSVERVFGGNLGTGNVGSATIIVNGGTITKGCHGGGQKGSDALLHSNSVGRACLVINGGNFGSVLSAGGVDVVSVGEVDMIINGGTMNYVYASGANGTTGRSNVTVNGGTMQHALSVVRTSVEDVTWTINGGAINELWIGADDDADDDGTIKHCIVNVLGGTVTALKLGYSGHVEGALTVEGTYVPGHITNEEAAVLSLGLVHDKTYAISAALAAENERAIGEETRLGTVIANENERAVGAEEALTSSLSDEADRAIAAEQQLASDITTERTRATEVENGLDTRLTTAESDIDSLEGRMNTAESDIDTVEGRLDAIDQVGTLASQDFVNSSINNIAAYFITNSNNEPFVSHAALVANQTYYSGGAPRTPTRNDYAVVLHDETQTADGAGNYPTTRYHYNNGWQFQYVVNNSGLTVAQFAALNSGLTAAGLSTILDRLSAIESAIPSDAGANNKLALANEVEYDIAHETQRARAAERALDIGLNSVNGKIPNEASASNKLADKLYVDTKCWSKVVTLPAANWSNKSQTVTVPGIIADDAAQLVHISPTGEYESEAIANEVAATATAADSITFGCDITPEHDVQMIVTVQEVYQAEELIGELDIEVSGNELVITPPAGTSEINVYNNGTLIYTEEVE